MKNRLTVSIGGMNIYSMIVLSLGFTFCQTIGVGWNDVKTLIICSPTCVRLAIENNRSFMIFKHTIYNNFETPKSRFSFAAFSSLCFHFIFWKRANLHLFLTFPRNFRHAEDIITWSFADLTMSVFCSLINKVWRKGCNVANRFRSFIFDGWLSTKKENLVHAGKGFSRYLKRFL